MTDRTEWPLIETVETMDPHDLQRLALRIVRILFTDGERGLNGAKVWDDCADVLDGVAGVLDDYQLRPADLPEEDSDDD